MFSNSGQRRLATRRECATLHCLRARLSPATSKNQSFKVGHICTFVLAFSTAHDVVAAYFLRFGRVLVHVHPKLPPRASASDIRREASLHSPNPCCIEIGSPALRGDMLWRPRQLPQQRGVPLAAAPHRLPQQEQAPSQGTKKRP